MKAVVLCGGLGTRLGELTLRTPKPMLAVAGRPFIAHVLDSLSSRGVEEIALAVSFKWEQLRDALGFSWRGIPLHYSVEPSPLGTGGAALRALDAMGWNEAIVANGDTLVKAEPQRLVARAEQANADIVMTLHWVSEITRYGGVHLAPDTRVQGFREKGAGGAGLINAGLYWLRRDVLTNCPSFPAFSLETDVLESRIAELRVFGVVTDGFFIDIGIPEDLQRARREL